MLVTPAGIVMLVRLVLFWNAPFAMPVTVRPLIVSGMVTSPPPVHPVMVIVLSLLVMKVSVNGTVGAGTVHNTVVRPAMCHELQPVASGR